MVEVGAVVAEGGQGLEVCSIYDLFARFTYEITLPFCYSWGIGRD